MTRREIPVAGKTASFRVDYACECGQARAVMANGIRLDLPLSTKRRDTGPCPACGRSRQWVIVKHPDRLVVKVL